MAAERDELGSTGPGMSGTGRDQAGMDAGTTRSMSMGDQPGTAEVHSGIAFAPESQQGTRERAAGKVRDVADTVSGAAGNLGEKARSVAGNVGGIPLQIVDGETGFLVNSAEECAQRCIQLLEDREEARAPWPGAASSTSGTTS